MLGNPTVVSSCCWSLLSEVICREKQWQKGQVSVKMFVVHPYWYVYVFIKFFVFNISLCFKFHECFIYCFTVHIAYRISSQFLFSWIQERKDRWEERKGKRETNRKGEMKEPRKNEKGRRAEGDRRVSRVQERSAQVCEQNH